MPVLVPALEHVPALALVVVRPAVVRHVLAALDAFVEGIYDSRRTSVYRFFAVVKYSLGSLFA